MWVDMNSVTPELEAAIYDYPWPVVKRFGETTISIRPFPPGTYYLCTDSGELTLELPKGPHREIVLERPALCLGIADEVWQKILHSIHLQEAPEGVQCLPGDNPRWRR